MNIHAFFPLNSKVDRQLPQSVVLVVIVYLAVCAVMKILDILLGWVPIIGMILGIVFWVVGLYCAVGIILAVIQYFSKSDA